MQNKVMVLGGYGNFGKRVSRALAFKGVDVLVVGRDASSAEALARGIGGSALGLAAKIPDDLGRLLSAHNPDVVVNTVGPFQGQNYDVARIAIEHDTHYVDLADGRQFVSNIIDLDDPAKAAGIAVISGASTVPALADAVLAEYSHEFGSIKSLRYGISPGQGAERGLATTKGILGYVGKPLAPFSSIRDRVYGWQDVYRQTYPTIGKRWMANCDIPDLDILPERFGIGTIQFSAGLELGFLHLGLWASGWLVRFGMPIPLERLASPLLAVSNWFNRFGSADGGMHIIMRGTKSSAADRRVERRWFIIAKNGDGPHIPTIPAILLAHRIASGQKPAPGAYPCVGLVSLQDYLDELDAHDIEVITDCRSIDP